MNTCILMAEIIQEPELRYTQENLQITEMLVEFPSLRKDDPPSQLKVISFGNLAEQIHGKYHQGDRVILEGRLAMNLVPKDGYKEKIAELNVQRIYSLNEEGANFSKDHSHGSTPNNVVPIESRNRQSKGDSSASDSSRKSVENSDNSDDPIPF
jgi:single-strand DNA-binding protein